MKEESFYSSEQASELFNVLNNAKSDVVFGHLGFLMATLGEVPKRVHFSYDTDHNHAWYLLGLAFESDGNYKDAATSFRMAAEIWPSDTSAFLAFSNCEEDLVLQTNFLEKNLGKNSDPEILFNLANAYFDLGKVKRSRELLSMIPTSVSFYGAVEESLERIKTHKMGGRH